jgi:hypothetical protein
MRCSHPAWHGEIYTYEIVRQQDGKMTLDISQYGVYLSEGNWDHT